MNTADQIKAFEQVARMFNISNESAKYFLNQIQKSFKTERPPHRLILEFLLKENYPFKPVPYDVASGMKDRRVWEYDLNPPPPVVQNENEFPGG